MTPPALPPRLARALLLLGLAALLATAAYQFSLPLTLESGSSVLPARTRGLFPAESGYRWTNGQGSVAVAGPGSGRSVVVDATVSAWRPRGRALPALRMGVGEASTIATLAPAPAAVRLEARTPFSWDGAVDVRLDSEAFVPGAGDPRPLGVRVHRLVLAPAGGVFAPGLPPPAPVLWVLAVGQLAYWTFGLRQRWAAGWHVGLALTVLLAVGLVLARAWTATLLPALGAAQALAFLAARLWPRGIGAAAGLLRAAGARVVGGVRGIRPLPLLGLLAWTAAGAILAYRAPSVVAIPLGGGRESAFEEGLGTFDAAEGARFRHAAPGAVLDLRDFGSGPWRVTVTAAAPGPLPSVPLLDVGDGVVTAQLGPGWSAHTAFARAPGGWRSGLRITFPVPRGRDVWLREVRVERGPSWPPLRILVWMAVAGLLTVLAVAASGLSMAAAWIAGLVLVTLEAAALAVDPVAAIPHVPRMPAIAAVTVAVAALAAAALGGARSGGQASVPPAAVAAGALGFLAWLATTAGPLYRGGHFVFHSSIAEEIWKGRFLLYYLPFPGSMLSQQAQWGNVVVPHPCLYHTLVAPLAALPRPWFFAAEKVVLALMLAGMVWAAAALASRLGPPGSAVAAAVLMAAMPASFQLLGLGHLMTVFGSWAMTLAVTFLAVHWEGLEERGRWWGAVLLTALCYLAYFAGLLFMALVLAITALARARTDPRASRRLLGIGLSAAALAFLLYYVNWAWPFLSESVPRLLSGSGSHASGSAGALPFRLRAAPAKLAYTFGTVLVPLAGLVGLWRARRGPARLLLLAWAAILPAFTILDLFFNFLLKHHYFTMVPVAVGGGVLLGHLAGRGRAGRLAVAAALGAVIVLGARVALDAALGRIP